MNEWMKKWITKWIFIKMNNDENEERLPQNPQISEN